MLNECYNLNVNQCDLKFKMKFIIIIDHGNNVSK